MNVVPSLPLIFLDQFEWTDLEKLELGELERREKVDQQLKVASQGASGYVHYSVTGRLGDGTVLGCGGVIRDFMAPTFWWTWLVLSERIRQHPYTVFRAARSLLQYMDSNMLVPEARILALISEREPAAKRFARRLRFVPQAGASYTDCLTSMTYAVYEYQRWHS